MGIIAGFAGVGKTTFCEKNKHAIDFICMPFKYENFIQIASKYGEKSIKAHEDLRLRDGWTSLYYDALIETYHSYPDEIIVIPTVGIVLERLEKDNIPYTLVYPCREAKNEYEARYIQRGDSENFLNIFVDGWEYWMCSVRLHKNANCIEFQANQYLSDVIQITEYDEDKIIREKECYIFESISKIAKNDFY